ncbi:hypothetical protein GIB67_006711 [Kingdonia uniflora]|uniref:FAD-binding PCMH-type domain-containing protein n=1 Tax=Kingdonia uniflora TaxID=39325 RepID=A0A7J7LYZ0_9MAGN|nr:hypothetical protein GIB67_006711 [Kingdonia uniflora]
MRNASSLLLILFILATTTSGTTDSIIITGNEKILNFFSCLLSGDVNYTIPSSPSFHQIFHLSAYNLRITNASSSNPVAIILPGTKEQLLATITCCKNAPWEFIIRSGGHSLEGLSYSACNHHLFVLIDLMNLNRVLVDVESKTAWVEAGATLGEIYSEVSRASSHFGFPAGLCPTVGSGGHIGGGGWGLMSRKYGLASDNVVDAILVDSNGRLLDRQMMGEDVFWAIRGGGPGSFGAVYSWKISLVDVPDKVTAFRITRSGSITLTAGLLHKWQFVAPKLEDEVTLLASIRSEPDTTNMVLVATFLGLYLGPKHIALASINRALPELGLHGSECNELSWIESMAYFPGINQVTTVEALRDRFSTSDQKNYYKWKSDFVRELISLSGIEGILGMLMKESRMVLVLSPFGGIMSRIKSDMVPFPHREGNLYSLGYFVYWDENGEKMSSAYMDSIQNFHEYITPFVSKGPRASYVNEIDLDLGVMDWENVSMSGDELVEAGRAWGEKYFLGNYGRLVRAKTMIDPNNVFRHQQSIPSKSIQDLGDDINRIIEC